MLLEVDAPQGVIQATAEEEVFQRPPDARRILKLDESGRVATVDVWFRDYRCLHDAMTGWQGWFFGSGEAPPARPRKGTQPIELRRADKPGRQFQRYGGATVCVMRNHYGEHSVGVALCSTGDKYNKRKGRYVAYNRACEAMFEREVPILQPAEVRSPVLRNAVAMILKKIGAA